MEPQINTYLGPYLLTEVVGHTGAAVVYKAHQPALDRYVAVKVLLRALDERDVSRFEPELTRLIRAAEELTAGNDRLTLTIAANYGGRWDILQAANRMLADRPQLAAGFEESDLTPYFALSHAPEPDLFIRTGGEQRISNFLLWQLAYTELYFTDLLWPDFDAAALDTAIASYQERERRFGRTSEQLPELQPVGAVRQVTG